MNQKLIITGVIAFLVGLGIGALAFGGGSNEVEDIASVDSEGMSDENAAVGDVEGETTVQSGVSFNVPNQPAGTQVVVSGVDAPANTWLTVHEDVGGMPGDIIGYQLLNGEANVTISLVTSTTPDTAYFVRAYSDDGDRIIDQRVDVPYDIVAAFQTLSFEIEETQPLGEPDSDEEA